MFLMSSISIVITVGGMAAYATSKVAVEQLAHILHLELAHIGIGVGTVYASWVDTPLIANAESAMPSFARLRRAWARPAELPGLSSWPGDRIQIWLLGRSSQQMDDEVRARAS